MQRTFIVICCSLLVFAAGCGQDDGDGTSMAPETMVMEPLRVQRDSRYVTDTSLWGQLLFDASSAKSNGLDPDDLTEITTIIEIFHRYWLDQDQLNIEGLLHPHVFRHRQGRSRNGREGVLEMLANESRGERPEGYTSSMQLSLRDLSIRSLDEVVATATYKIDIRGGARWEYADMATVLQVFVRTDGGWLLAGHSETLALGDANAPTLPDDVPNRVAPYTFSFGYPVHDLQRAVGFYQPLLGAPIEQSANKALFKIGRSYFELTSQPIDPRILIKPGMANGYGIVDVESLEVTREKLAALGAKEFSEVPCEGTQCMVTEDPSGNVIVWRKLAKPAPNNGGSPVIVIDPDTSDSAWAPRVLEVMTAWVSADIEKTLSMTGPEVNWIDDSVGLATGQRELKPLLAERWGAMGASAEGIHGQLTISEIKGKSFGGQDLVTFEADLSIPERPRDYKQFLVTQVWSGESGKSVLTANFMLRAREATRELVRGMDYTAYPVDDLGMAGAYYKQMFASEPYRDTNWFGFWSTTSVFGLVGKYSGELTDARQRRREEGKSIPPDSESYAAIPHTSNGYADLSIGSAEAVYEYLKQAGSEFPVVEAINDVSGIDSQPGYRQILATDSEGNLINFSQYLEY